VNHGRRTNWWPRFVASAPKVGGALGTLPIDVFFAPQGDKWSPAEHALHLEKPSAPLAFALRLPAWLLRLRFGRPNRPARAFVKLREDYLQALAGGGQAGRIAPAREGQPQNANRRRGEIMTKWWLTNARLCMVLARWREDRLDAVQLPHPLLGMLTVREMGCVHGLPHIAPSDARNAARSKACSHPLKSVQSVWGCS